MKGEKLLSANTKVWGPNINLTPAAGKGVSSQVHHPQNGPDINLASKLGR